MFTKMAPVAMWALPGLLVDVVLVCTGLVCACVAVSVRTRSISRAAIAQAAGLAVATALVVAYGTSADSYLGDGTSVWEATDEKGLTVVAVCLGLGAIAVLLVASRRLSGLAVAFAASAFVAVVQIVATFVMAAD